MMRTIPNFSRYVAGEDGNLYSTNYKRTGKLRVLKPAINKSGYLNTVLLDDSGKYRPVLVHRVVCSAYIGEVPQGMEVNHKNGIKTDNRPENLEYVTRSENLKHAFRIGLEKPLRCDDNPCAKLTKDDVREIRSYVRSCGRRYYGRKELAEKYGVSEAHIKDIVNGRRNVWADIA